MSIFRNAAIGTFMVCVAAPTVMAATKSDFNYVVDRFADIEVLRYKVPGFEE